MINKCEDITLGDGCKMATITGLSRQKRNNDYYNIFIDEKFAFSVHGELILLHGLKEGEKIDPFEIGKIIEEDNKKRAFNHSLYYLSFRRRTQSEIEKYLEDKEYGQEIIKEAVSKLKDYKIIDDQEYVRSFISDKMTGNPIGRKKIIFDLERKGISQELLSNIDQWYPEDEEYNQAERLFTKYKKKYSKSPARERKQKIYMAGQRRGFSWEILRKVIDENIEVEEVYEENSSNVNHLIDWAKKYKTRYEKKGLEGYILKQKVGQALLNRGYRWDDIQDILRKVMEEEKT